MFTIIIIILYFCLVMFVIYYVYVANCMFVYACLFVSVITLPKKNLTHSFDGITILRRNHNCILTGTRSRSTTGWDTTSPGSTATCITCATVS